MNETGYQAETEKWSGHWPEDIVMVSAKYPQDLKRFLESKKTEFERVWSG